MRNNVKYKREIEIRRRVREREDKKEIPKQKKKSGREEEVMVLESTKKNEITRRRSSRRRKVFGLYLGDWAFWAFHTRKCTGAQIEEKGM